jgi:hypothetical protein
MVLIDWGFIACARKVGGGHAAVVSQQGEGRGLREIQAARICFNSQAAKNLSDRLR